MSPHRQTAIQFGSWVVAHRLGVIRARVMNDLRADSMGMLLTGVYGPLRVWGALLKWKAFRKSVCLVTGHHL